MIPFMIKLCVISFLFQLLSELYSKYRPVEYEIFNVSISALSTLIQMLSFAVLELVG